MLGRLVELIEVPEEFRALARALLARIGPSVRGRVLTLGADAEARLVAWHWPGNVRELANTLERAAILTERDVIGAGDVWLEASAPPPASTEPAPPVAAARPLVELERDAIVAALTSVAGNRRKAAEVLGIAERTLYDKLKRYGIE